MPRRSTPAFQNVLHVGLFALAFALPACSPEERNFGTSGTNGTGGQGGTGSTGSVGGAGGMTMSTSSSGMPTPCTSPVECPKGGPCETPACTAGQCGLVLVVDTTSCSSEGHICMNGQCVCPDGLVDCNGTCLDTMSDALNCGACGHDCLGGGCTTGVCEPVPLAISQGSVDGIAVDTDHVYWTRKGANRVMRIPKDGSSGAQVFAPGQEAPTGIALSATEVFWINEGTASSPALIKMAKAGGLDIKLVGALKNPHRLGTDAQFVYWYEFANGTTTIKKLDQAGGPVAPLTLASASSTPQDIVVGGGYVYWSGYLFTLQKAIRRVPVDGGVDVVVSTAVDRPSFLALDDSFVYASSDANGAILRVPVGGGLPEPLVPGQGTQAPHIALDKDYLYWTTGATVMRVPLVGGMPETLAKGQSGAGEIAVDSTRVYWGTGDGKLMMWVK